MAFSERSDRLLRVLSCGVIVASLAYMATRAQSRFDVTAEGLSRLTQHTRDLVDAAAKSNPVHITAYVSRDVPRDYVGHRDRLLNVLREIDAQGGDAITLQVFEPALHSEAAQDAIDKFGIFPQQLLDAEAGRVGALPVFMGVALTSGPREEVMSFIDRGLSPEYELARALSVVVKAKKRVVGIVASDVKMMGDFDLQARRQIPAWAIVEELRKQYEVRNLELGAEIPKDIDVVIVPQVSSLGQPALDKLSAYADAGRPLLVVADPMPVFDVRLSPSEPMLPSAGQGGFGGMGGQQPGEPKGDYQAFLKKLGVEWSSNRVIYDAEQLNPQYRTPPHVLFMTRSAPEKPFVEGTGISDSLAQVVAMYGGSISPIEGESQQFTPLLATSSSVAYHDWNSLVDRSNFFFGLRGPVPPQNPPIRMDEAQVVAARIVKAGETEAEKPDTDSTAAEKATAEVPHQKGALNAIVLADLDMFSNVFFQLHSRGGDVDGDGLVDQRFDNVTFLLNCIDTLAGDESFIELRSRQPEFRRLTLVDQSTKDARDRREAQITAANSAAEDRLATAQASLDAKVAEVEKRSDLDATTKAIMARQIQEAETRRFKRDEEAIERDKQRELDRIETEHLKSVDTVQDGLRLGAVLIPPIPAIALGLYIFLRKRRRESASIPAQRKRAGA